MRKILGCLLTVIMILTVLIPTGVYAEVQGNVLPEKTSSTTSYGILSSYDVNSENLQSPTLSIEGPVFSATDSNGTVAESVYDTVYGAVYFSTYVNIDYASSIFAEDFTVNYDTSCFEYIKASSTNDKIQILHEDTVTPGELRFIMASKGEQYGIYGSEKLLKLTFKAKHVNGFGEIRVASGLVANHLGNEMTCLCKGKLIRVITIDADVNGDGRCSVGDLAITAFNLDRAPWNWTNPKVDVDKTGSVDLYDLKFIVQKILGN